MLNISDYNHLNRHPNINVYYNSKLSLLTHLNYAVTNHEYSYQYSFLDISICFLIKIEMILIITR